MVELAAATAGDVREDAVEDERACLVEVATLVKELAQQPPGLRHPVAEGRLEITVAPEVGDGVAHGEQGRPRHRAIARAVDQRVPVKSLEPAVQRDGLRVAELPAGPLDRDGFGSRGEPFVEHRFGVVQGGRRVVGEGEQHRGIRQRMVGLVRIGTEFDP
jgi:hypothetical protein